MMVFCAGVNAYLASIAIFSSGLVSLSEYTNLVDFGFSFSFSFLAALSSPASSLAGAAAVADGASGAGAAVGAGIVIAETAADDDTPLASA